MRRWPWMRVGLSLVMGVVLTLGMAWVPARVLPAGFLIDNYERPLVTEYRQGHWMHVIRGHWLEQSFGQAESVSVHDVETLVDLGVEVRAFEDVRFAGLNSMPLDDEHWTRSEFETFGLPFRCVYNRVDHLQDAVNPLVWHRRVYGQRQFRIANMSKLWLYVSIRPLWFGLLGNAAVWSLTAFLALTALVRVRAAVRTRRGQCPACGYNLAGITNRPCPECGREPRKSGPGLATRA